MVPAEASGFRGSEPTTGDRAGVPGRGNSTCKGQEMSENLAALGRVESRKAGWSSVLLSLDCQSEGLVPRPPAPSTGKLGTVFSRPVAGLV